MRKKVFQLPDTAEETMGDKGRITPVQEADLALYRFHKEDGRIAGKERRGEFLYYYVDEPIFIHGWLPEGGDGHTTSIYSEVERYRVKLYPKSNSGRR